MTKTYRGWLVEASWGEADDVLYLAEDRSRIGDEPLASRIKYDMRAGGHFLSVRYFLAPAEETPEALEASLGQALVGMGYAKVGHRYSEITGYLWTDEEIMVGGHNLIDELHTHRGQWCHLEIEFSQEART